MSGRRLDLLVLGLAGGEYALNHFWLRRVTEGWLRWFLVCYANDILAGAFLLAWVNLLLGRGKLGRLRDWKMAVPLLLACALVWEGAAPLWKAGAVFDLWDFAAYQVGGALYLLAEHRRTQKRKEMAAG